MAEALAVEKKYL